MQQPHRYGLLTVLKSQTASSSIELREYKTVKYVTNIGLTPQTERIFEMGPPYLLSSYANLFAISRVSNTQLTVQIWDAAGSSNLCEIDTSGAIDEDMWMTFVGMAFLSMLDCGHEVIDTKIYARR